MVFRRIITAAITMIGFAALVAGVSNAGATTTRSTTSQVAATSSGVTTGAGACTKYGKNITLNVGFSEAGSAILDGFNGLARSFEAANPNVKVKAALLDGKPVAAKELETLANLPSRTELVGKLLGLMQSPIRRLVTVLAAPHRNVAATLAAVAQQKAKSEETAA